MAINFPNTPSLNQEYSVDNRTWVWNGDAWQLKSTLSSTSATALATARTITLNGVVTGSTSFDGSADVTITTSTSHPFTLNTNVVTGSHTIPSGYNGVAAGPIYIANGGSVEVAAGSVWTIV